MAQVGLLEDNTRIARLCATMLQYAGHDVTIYEHPRECLRALLISSDYRHEMYTSALSGALPVDLLMLDLHLPDINGMEVLRYLRSHSHTKSLPLIFCTAAPPSEIAQALSIAPEASLIEKPFTFQELISTVTDVLKGLSSLK
ncbi:MAG: response regulator [Ktedonobacteraceae bacterium]|nr:response regulator [Ktedonobacteraceae bacterium]